MPKLSPDLLNEIRNKLPSGMVFLNRRPITDQYTRSQHTVITVLSTFNTTRWWSNRLACARDLKVKQEGFIVTTVTTITSVWCVVGI